MSLKDVTIDNSVKELEKIKALLELSILKNASNRESQGEIDEIDGRYQGYRLFNKVIMSYLLSSIKMFQTFFIIRYANFVGLIKYSSRHLIGSKLCNKI